MRMIERAVQAIARAFKALLSKDDDRALEILAEARRDLLGGEVSGQRSAQGWLKLLGERRPELDRQTRGHLLAALFAAEASAFEKKEDWTESVQRSFLAIQLILLAEQSDSWRPRTAESFPDWLPSLEELRQNLRGAKVPAQTALALAEGLSRRGAFAAAEDVLFELVEDSQEGLQEAIALYEHWVTLRDPELRAGGLPRIEVEAGLRELQAMGPNTA